MDRTDPDPKAPVDAALIEATYRFYLGRSPHPETAQALIDRAEACEAHDKAKIDALAGRPVPAP